MQTDTPSRWLDYRTVWRWHFYAGLFSIPFVLILSITGAIYLFKPQIEKTIDRPYENLPLTQSPRLISGQVTAVLSAIPDAKFDSYELPPNKSDAGRVMVQSGNESIRCYVHPFTHQIMHQVKPDDQMISIVKRIHGELLIGQPGSYLVELAACWTIVMILTGIFLWWPRKRTGFAGVLYPRIRSGSKPFWRDIHSVTGVWISTFALILIMTGLPWAAFWGEYFRSIRNWTGTAVAKQEWTVGNEPKPSEGEHENHQGHDHRLIKTVSYEIGELDRVIETVRPLKLAPPVIVSPPKTPDGTWAVKSMTGNRPQRVTLSVDGVSGTVIDREDFGDRHLIDKIVGVGIALHEGQLFGWINQAIGLVTVMGLMLLSLSGLVLWWRRRHVGLLGAPKATTSPSHSPLLIIMIACLAIYLPIFGASLLAVLAADKFLLRHIPYARVWLGLSSA